MPFIVGIDEVGYGPFLGPFVVCAVAAEVPSLESDLWKLLRGTRIPVRDSKKLFSQQKGIGALEPTALAYLSQLWPIEGLTHSGLWSLLSTDPRRAPWYDRDLSLPVTDHKLRGEILRDACARRRVRIAGAWARILEPADYNAKVGENKAELLFACAADLMKRALGACPGEIAFFIGKQGGRTFYHRHLTESFGMVMTREESASRSSYQAGRATVTFLVDGEDRHFLIALASIIGKYMRELSMRLFNAYWTERLEIRPTAGYGKDARRFYSEIEHHLARHEIDPASVLRRR